MKEFTILAFSTLRRYLDAADPHITRYAVPLRSLTRATPDDLLILPDNGHVRDLVRLYENELNDRPFEILWTKDTSFQLDLDIAADPALLEQIQSAIDQRRAAGRRIVLHPYSYTFDTQSWVCQLRGIDRIIGDPPHLVERYQGKDIYYPPVSNPEAETISRMVPRLNIPPGYVCRDRRELLLAADLLAARGIGELLLKPVIGSSGSGITPVRDRRDLEEFQIPAPYILCQRVRTGYSDLMKCELNCAIEILDGKIFGPPTSQFVLGPEWIGGVAPGIHSEPFEQSALAQAQALLDHLLPLGLGAIGGLDFIGDERGDCYLVDNNLTRETGCHFPKYFQANYAPQQVLACREAPVPTLSPHDFFERLKGRGLAFTRQSRRGVFPFHYIRHGYSMLIALAATAEEAMGLLDEAVA